MINWVHRDTAYARPHTHPASPAGLADADILMIQVSHLPN
jgi:hypothetical protein